MTTSPAHPTPRTAAVITVGTELTRGVRLDTNTAEIARELTSRGLDVTECVSVGDDAGLLTLTIRRLMSSCDLVIATGGLGPTHDDVTREAAAAALGVRLVRDTRLTAMLEAVARRHTDAEAVERTFRQADVLDGARVIDFTSGTAPGQVLRVDATYLVLLPGPPPEMRPMLRAALEPLAPPRMRTRTLGVTGLTESDAQVRVSRVIKGHSVGFTVLARPGDVQVLLTDQGAGPQAFDAAISRVVDALGTHCYSTDGRTLPMVVLDRLRSAGLTLALAESCTGGLVAAALTDVAGSSDVFVGSAVTYSNKSKSAILGVPEPDIATHGAVSEEVALSMATGALSRFGSDIAVAVTGIAGPGGGSASKPVGTVWFAIARRGGVARATLRSFAGGSRDAVRARATAAALDMVRCEVARP